MFLMCTGASDPAVPSALRVGAVHCAPSSLSAHLNNLPRAPAPHSPPTIIACKTICRVKNVPKFADPPSRKYVCISLFCLLSNFIPMKSGVSSQLASGLRHRCGAHPMLQHLLPQTPPRMHRRRPAAPRGRPRGRAAHRLAGLHGACAARPFDHGIGIVFFFGNGPGEHHRHSGAKMARDGPGGPRTVAPWLKAISVRTLISEILSCHPWNRISRD